MGRLPWDPFPAGSAEKGPDPLHGALYRAAVGGADAYRAVRQVLRVERGVLRVGNRFVPEGRYRQVGFVALGHAAASLALAALDALGERLTQGFVAGPEAPPPYLPFRSAVVEDGWAPVPAAREVVEAAREIPEGLSESDLFLVLVSPGATRAILEPPPSVSAEELGRRLRAAHDAGATAEEVGTVLRAAGGGGVGGRLLPAEVRCDVQTLLVDRGNGPALTGGGPTVPVSAEERARAHELLPRFGLEGIADLPNGGQPLRSAAAPGARPRPVVVAGPSDALRATADLAFDKGWTSRVGELLLPERPDAAADRFLARVDELLPDVRTVGPGRTKGLVTVAMATLDVPDGVDEGPACREFLARAQTGLRRRELSVGLYRTGGPLGGAERREVAFAGGVVGAVGDPESRAAPGSVRSLAMRPGITDVGLVAVAIVGAVPESARPSSG